MSSQMCQGSFDYVPVPSAILGSGVFGSNGLNLGRELDVVAVVEHDEVVQSEISCKTACAL